MSNLVNGLTEAKIAQLLVEAQGAPLDNPYPETLKRFRLLSGDPRPAAVLIPLLIKDGSWHVLLTRRNPGLAEHSGQVAFPGGRSEDGDPTLEYTALREAQEEIGLNPADVRILGRLSEFLTITNYRVTPIIGVIPWPYPLELEREEVSRAFTIPLEWLSHPANYEFRQRGLPLPNESVKVIYFQPYEGEVLWGASARFMMALLDILTSEVIS